MRYLKAVLFLTILIFLLLFLRATDLQGVASSLKQVGYGFAVLLITTMLAYFSGTVGWRYCMGSEGRQIAMWQLFIIRHVGETVSLINPTSIVGGEALKVFLLKDKGIQRKTVITSVLVSRMLMVLTQLVLFFLAAGVVLFESTATFSSGSSLSGVFLVLIVLGISALLLLFFLRKIRLRIKWGSAVKDRLTRAGVRIKELWVEMIQFYRRNKSDLFLSAFFFVLHWILGSLEFYFILRFLGINTGVLQALFIDMGVVFFKAAGAFIPGQIGVEEYGNKVMLASVGVQLAEIWIAASVLRRARQLFWIAFGFVGYFWISRTKKNMLTESGYGDPVR